MRAAARGINDFSLELYVQLASAPGNLVCSPLSASTALAMTLVGARGETEREMARVLRAPGPAAELFGPYGAVLRSLRARDEAEAIELAIANRVWAQAGLEVQAGFRETLAQAFASDLGLVDFREHTEPARLEINRWANEQTRGKIPGLLAPGVLNSRTRMVLVNAVYFLAAWEHPFSPEQTSEAPFTLADGTQVTVPMMRQTASFRVADEESVQWLELPYSGGELGMVLVLPKRVDGLDEVESVLDLAFLQRGLAAMEHSQVLPDARPVDVSLPRFLVRTSLDLVPLLRSMGMRRAFGEEADFSGISPTKLAIDAVVQQAVIDVGERGTEAAAATGITMGLTSVGPPPIAFRADHPFLFLIRDRVTGTVLFLGRVAHPGA